MKINLNVRLEDYEMSAIKAEARVKGCTVSELVRAKLGYPSISYNRNQMTEIKLVPFRCYKENPGDWESTVLVYAWMPEAEEVRIAERFAPGERVSLPMLRKLKIDIRTVEPCYD